MKNLNGDRLRICQASQSSGRIRPNPIRAKFQQSIWAQKAQKRQRERETQCVNDIFETEPTKRSAKTASGEVDGRKGTIKSGGEREGAQLNSRLAKWGARFSFSGPIKGSVDHDFFASRNSKIPPLTGKSPFPLSITTIFPDPGSVRHRSLPDESARNQSGRNFNSLFGHKKAQKRQRERETQCVNDIFEKEPTKRYTETSSGEGGTIKSGGEKGRGPIKLSPDKVGARFSLSGPIKGSVDREAWTARLSLAASSLIRTPVSAAAVITGAPPHPTPYLCEDLRAATFLPSLLTLSRPCVSSLMSSFLIFHSKTNKPRMK
ncbi:hypothetical protein CEXT_198991 [Caerostris extrusa]|uniref:Uncharacterized protein n=1 Tax=Caerostris extrusa TaxID=172846 RepID=A0AAV4WRH6_CAEEX|nr:hypothetical protein CEXT_198991 [Caerostris extrusa]